MMIYIMLTKVKHWVAKKTVNVSVDNDINMCSWLRLLVIEREREIEPVDSVPLNERRAHGSDTTLQKPEIPDLVKPNRYLRHHQSSFVRNNLKHRQ